MVDYRAQQNFIFAIDRTWSPAPLDQVAKAAPAIDSWLDTLPQFRRIPGNPQGEVLAWQMNLMNPTWPFRWSSLAADTGTEADDARRAVTACLAPYPLPTGAEWLRDVVIHTVAYRKIARVETMRWAYNPDQPIKPRSILIPYCDTEAEFVKVARSMWRREHKVVSSALGMRRSESTRDAEWLARWLAGESDSSLAKASRKYDEELVRKARGRFAERVGLTLPISLTTRDKKPSIIRPNGQSAKAAK